MPPRERPKVYMGNQPCSHRRRQRCIKSGPVAGAKRDSPRHTGYPRCQSVRSHQELRLPLEWPTKSHAPEAIFLFYQIFFSPKRYLKYGHEYTGDAILPRGTFDASKSISARVIVGDILGNFTITKQVKPIRKLLSPLPNERVRTVRCVGFNYVAHNGEAGQPIPGWPILFFKPFTALNTPSDPIPVTAGYQTQGNFTSTMDYETELVIVIKKKAFNISDDEALDHVLGFSVGHDVSHRGWQIDRGGQPQPQFSMGKGADGWAPWGPAIVSTNIIPDPQTLNIWTKVNGVTMQNDTTANMIFGVKHLVSFFSMGITLLPGDVIFTGTPAGVNLGKANPVWLTDGDVVEVGLENVGTCTNMIKYV